MEDDGFKLHFSRKNRKKVVKLATIERPRDPVSATDVINAMKWSESKSKEAA